MHESWKLLVFGASGAIGRTVTRRARARGWTVVGATRGEAPAGQADGLTSRRSDPFADEAERAFRDVAPFGGARSTQGAVTADRIRVFDREHHFEPCQTNCLFIMKSAFGLAA